MNTLNRYDPRRAPTTTENTLNPFCPRRADEEHPFLIRGGARLVSLVDKAGSLSTKFHLEDPLWIKGKGWI